MSGVATLDGVPFKVNPSTIRWSYNVKLASTKTIGGKVIQLYGWTMGDLTIGGTYGGPDSHKTQKEFQEFLDSVATEQAPKIGRGPTKPVRLLWPDQGWDFWVFIKQVVQPGTSVSREIKETTHAPTYQITFFVYQDNGDIIAIAASSAQAKYLSRFTAGLGWSQSEWNGPETVEKLKENLQNNTVSDFLFSQYGLLEINGIPTVPPAPSPATLNGPR